MACPPTIPQQIDGCDPQHYTDFILIPYAAELVLYNNEQINCAEFQARVDAMQIAYDGACGPSS